MITKQIVNTPDWIEDYLYPFDSRIMELSAGKMHYIDEGKGETLLFVHGTPTWSFVYRKLIKELAADYRCIAIDHIGFGLSEKVEGFSGKPEDHSANLVEFIHRMNLRNVTLVVHDFGGPIGLGAGLTFPDRINKVVLMNSWLWGTKEDPAAIKVDKIVNQWLGEFMYLSMNFSAKILLKQAFSDKKLLSKEVHQHYLNPFPDKASRKPLLQLAQALVGSSDWYHRQWKNLHRLSDKEWLILWGMKDPFLGASYLERWKSRLPFAEVRELDSGHFVQEEKSNEVISAIREFL
ncbi:MAG: alpha/beta fold hydrolase [Bacteroidota bacterium]